jgi:queuosine precursor transporter
MKFKYTALYIVLIVAVNYGFSVVPLVELPGGDKWPPLTLVVGFIFVLRDFAQREIGHSVILAMLVAAAISYFMADPYVALASLAAFLVSEFCDWAVYTFTKKPFAQRVLLSSALGTPVDSVIFLSMIGIASVQGVVLMTISKMLGALAVWYMIKNRSAAKAV